MVFNGGLMIITDDIDLHNTYRLLGVDDHCNGNHYHYHHHLRLLFTVIDNYINDHYRQHYYQHDKEVEIISLQLY